MEVLQRTVQLLLPQYEDDKNIPNYTSIIHENYLYMDTYNEGSDSYFIHDNKSFFASQEKNKVYEIKVKREKCKRYKR